MHIYVYIFFFPPGGLLVMDPHCHCCGSGHCCEAGWIPGKGTPIRISADFSTETLQARREWQEIFKVLKGKNMQPRILYPARISFKMEGEIKFFPTNKS